jgi:rod shape-determining protein MreC
VKRPQPRASLAFALILTAIGLMILNVAGFLQPVESLALRPLGAIQGWVSLRYAAVRDLLGSPNDITSLRGQNAELEAQVAQLQQQIVSLQEQVAEARILAALVNYAREQPDSSYLASKVIGRDVSPFLRSIWIGNGSDSGIERNMPVVTEQGLVGRVVEVFATASRIQLVTDPAAAVNVRLQTSRADGVLAAQLNGELSVDLIDQNKTVTPGELVLTSGLGGGFPADIPIGKVISVQKRDFAVFQQAVIQPSVDYANLEIVLVITNFRPIPVTTPSP